MKTIPVRHIASALSLHSDAGRFSVRDLQQVLNGKNLVHDLHRHDFYFVLAVKHGSGIHEIDFVQYPVQANAVFILRPGQVHTIAEHRWKKASSKNYCEVEAARFKRLHTHLAAIFNEYSLKQEGYREAIKANLDLFFLEYIRQSKNPNSIAKSESGYIQERFEEFVRLLETNIVSMKNVSDYADLLSLSPYQVKEVADQLGYEDPSYFIRFFRKHTGQSPEAFRKNFK